MGHRVSWQAGDPAGPAASRLPAPGWGGGGSSRVRREGGAGSREPGGSPAPGTGLATSGNAARAEAQLLPGGPRGALPAGRRLPRPRRGGSLWRRPRSRTGSGAAARPRPAPRAAACERRGAPRPPALSWRPPRPAPPREVGGGPGAVPAPAAGPCSGAAGGGGGAGGTALPRPPPP